MEKGTSQNDLEDKFTNCRIKYEESETSEMVINDDNHIPLKLQVNEISTSLSDGSKGFQNDEELSIFKGDFSDYDELANESNIVFNSNDQMFKLDTLFRNFQELFTCDTSLKSGSESNSKSIICQSNRLEGEKQILTEDETECYILEHKSIRHLKFKNDEMYEESTISGTELDAVLEDTEKKNNELSHEDGTLVNFGFSNSEDIDSGCVNLSEITCEVYQEEDLNVAKDTEICETLKTNSLAQESLTNKEINNEFPYPLGKTSTYLDKNNTEDTLKPLEILKHDELQKRDQVNFRNLKSDVDTILNQTKSKHDSMKGRVFVVMDSKELDIHESVRRGDTTLLRRLLAEGADPNEPDWGGKGDPPIVQAALRQNMAIVKSLCEAGCDINLTSVRGETALHMAVSRRPVDLPLVDTLLAAGCDPNTQDKLRGCSALHCVSGFADDEPQVFLRLLSVTDVNLRDHRHSTVLHRVAATSNNVMWIKQLVELGADLSVQNDRGETALCVALERGWVAGALALVAGGTDLHRTNLYRETALHVAARHNQATVVAALLRHDADVNAADLAGNTALHLAAGRGYVDTVRQLLACPSLDLDTHNTDDATPLTCAVESGFISVVQMLVEAEEVDLQPALDVAKQGYRRLSQPEMCQLLTKELARRQMPHII